MPCFQVWRVLVFVDFSISSYFYFDASFFTIDAATSPRDFIGLPFLACILSRWPLTGFWQSWPLPLIHEYMRFAMLPVKSRPWRLPRRAIAAACSRASPGQLIYIISRIELEQLARSGSGEIDYASYKFQVMTARLFFPSMRALATRHFAFPDNTHKGPPFL